MHSPQSLILAVSLASVHSPISPYVSEVHALVRNVRIELLPVLASLTLWTFSGLLDLGFYALDHLIPSGILDG